MVSCRSANVRVVDSSGRPVAGAEVIPYASSIYYGSVETGDDGRAYVRRSRWGQNVLGVSVNKPGYRSGSADFNRSKKVTVRLSR